MIGQLFLMIFGILVCILAVPPILGWVPRNEYFVWLTDKTLYSDRHWYPAMRFFGWAFLTAGLVMILGALLLMMIASKWPVATIGRVEGWLIVGVLLSAIVAGYVYEHRL